MELSKGGGAWVGERHDAILAELEDIFLVEGFRDVNVSELASRLRCSKRTLYEIAPSKQELFLLVMDRWLRRIRHLGWQSALKESDPRKRFEVFLKPGIAESKKATKRFVADVNSFAPALSMLRKHQSERTEFLAELIEDGIKRGYFRPLHARMVAEVYLISISRVNEPDFLESVGVSFSEAFAELSELLLKGLLKPPGRSKS